MPKNIQVKERERNDEKGEWGGEEDGKRKSLGKRKREMKNMERTEVPIEMRLSASSSSSPSYFSPSCSTSSSSSSSSSPIFPSYSLEVSSVSSSPSHTRSTFAPPHISPSSSSSSSSSLYFSSPSPSSSSSTLQPPVRRTLLSGSLSFSSGQEIGKMVERSDRERERERKSGEGEEESSSMPSERTVVKEKGKRMGKKEREGEKEREEERVSEKEKSEEEIEKCRISNVSPSFPLPSSPTPPPSLPCHLSLPILGLDSEISQFVPKSPRVNSNPTGFFEYIPSDPSSSSLSSLSPPPPPSSLHSLPPHTYLSTPSSSKRPRNKSLTISIHSTVQSERDARGGRGKGEEERKKERVKEKEKREKVGAFLREKMRESDKERGKSTTPSESTSLSPPPLPSPLIISPPPSLFHPPLSLACEAPCEGVFLPSQMNATPVGFCDFLPPSYSHSFHFEDFTSSTSSASHPSAYLSSFSLPLSPSPSPSPSPFASSLHPPPSSHSSTAFSPSLLRFMSKKKDSSVVYPSLSPSPPNISHLCPPSPPPSPAFPSFSSKASPSLLRHAKIGTSVKSLFHPKERGKDGGCEREAKFSTESERRDEKERKRGREKEEKRSGKEERRREREERRREREGRRREKEEGRRERERLNEGKEILVEIWRGRKEGVCEEGLSLSQFQPNDHLSVSQKYEEKRREHTHAYEMNFDSNTFGEEYLLEEFSISFTQPTASSNLLPSFGSMSFQHGDTLQVGEKSQKKNVEEAMQQGKTIGLFDLLVAEEVENLQVLDREREREEGEKREREEMLRSMKEKERGMYSTEALERQITSPLSFLSLYSLHSSALSPSPAFTLSSHSPPFPPPLSPLILPQERDDELDD